MLEAACLTGVSENRPWQDGQTAIPARANLNVRWEAPTKAIPSKVWIYRLLPNKFAPEIISNIMILCSLTDKDKIEQSTNGVTFKSPDGARTLSISFPSGWIHYETAQRHYGPTNLAEGVPPMREVPKLAADVLAKMGISLSEITNPYDSGRNIEGTSKFHLSEPLKIYYLDNTNVTNVEYRAAGFWRCVDGIPVIAGDSGGISFGEHGKIRGFSITWRSLERCQSLPTVTQTTAMEFLREGKAVQGPVLGSIDWSAVEKVTVNEASPWYHAGHTNWLCPFLELVATTEPAYGNVRLRIDCPVVDETKLAVP